MREQQVGRAERGVVEVRRAHEDAIEAAFGEHAPGDGGLFGHSRTLRRSRGARL